MATSTASIFTYPRFQALSNEGNPLAGGQLFTYQAGTLIPQATYTDSTLTVPNTNPIILDAFGTAAIWLGQNAYKFNLLDVNSVQQANFPIDNISGYGSSLTAALASTTSASLGQGLIGFNPALSYPLGTLPGDLASPLYGDSLLATQRTQSGIAQTQNQLNQSNLSILGFMTPGQYAAWVASPTTYDMTSILQNAINKVAPGRLELLHGTYLTSSPLSCPNGLHLVGTGFGMADATPTGSAIITNSTSDIFTNGNAGLMGAVFENLTLISQVGGGHIWNFNGSGTVTGCEFKDFVAIQNNPAKAVMTCSGTGGFFVNWIHHFAMQYAGVNTIPAINLPNVALSHVTIEDFYSYGVNTVGGTYAIWLEGAGGTQGYACSVKNGCFELSQGGMVKVLSCINVILDQCLSWDFSTSGTNPSFYFGKSGTTSSGSLVAMRGCRSTTGNATYPDIQVDGATSNLSLEACQITWLDGITTSSSNVQSFRNSQVFNLSNVRWTEDSSYLPSAGINLGAYVYAAGINNTLIYKVDISGGLTLGSSGQSTVHAGGMTQGLAGTSSYLNGNQAAANAGADWFVSSQIARTAGSIMAWQNNGANIAAVNYSGGVQPGQLNVGGNASSSTIYSGTGAPNNTYGANGDFYLRSDTPGTANQRLYVKSGGTWAGIL